LWISLANVNRALIGGLLLGVVILALSFVNNLGIAYAVMIATGICGGSFVVPLNALLQERGHQSIGAGNALAVQNFAENIAMLVFVGGYSLTAQAGVSITLTIAGFGLVLLLVIGSLAGMRLKTRGQ
jgi:LPLT family lysophospholipid transporter-like MFS transporter